jgi:hypothetical protein
MNRLFFTLLATAATAATLSAAPAGKKLKRKALLDSPKPTTAPSAVAPTTRQDAKQPDLSTPWRIWSDASGRKIEAAFCALQGTLCTVQTKEGQTYRLNLAALIPADRLFAQAYAAKLNENRFKDAYVKQAAFQIDHLIGSTLVAKGQKFNSPASDEHFVRRLYLDTVGRVPTADEAASFLKDTSPDKRAKLIDSLLDSPGYAMHMYNWLADTFRVKDEFGRGAKAYLFQDWLKDQLAADRPWDAMVKEMLTADGKLCENGAAGFLLRDAQMPLDGVANLLTTFLGANVSCAQCHDHPLAQWTQRDFYQMAAFFGATEGYDEAAYRQSRKLARNPTAGLNKQQVQGIAGVNVFRLTDTGKQDLKFPKDYKYDDAKPGSPVAPALISWTTSDAKLPSYKVNTSNPQQLRDEFATWMTNPENPRFATNIANRTWKKVFGLAVQEPVSDIDDPKGASNPQLLAHLTAIMKTAKFDLRQFQRVLLNSQTYQRAASLTPDLEKGPYLFPGPLLRRMTAEQTWDSILALTSGREVDNALLRRGDEMQLFSLPGNAMTAENFKYVIERVKDAGIQMGGYGGGGKKGKGANPTKLMAAYEGAKPQQRNGLLLARASELPQPAPESHFLRLFGQSDRLVADSNTTDGSVPQALTMMNGPIAQLIADANSAAVVAANSGKSRDEQIDSLYMSFFARKPSISERSAATKALEGGLALGDVAWSLLNSREFLFVQ